MFVCFVFFILNAILYTYNRPVNFCINKLTTIIPTQQNDPSNIGFPPVFINLTISVLRPIAPIAITIKNLLTASTMMMSPKKNLEKLFGGSFHTLQRSAKHVARI